MKRHWQRVGVAGVLAWAASAWAVEQALVDFSISGAAMTHRGSGFLHSIDGGDPPDALIAPLKPQMFRQRPQAAPSFDARAHQLGAQYMQILVSDGFNPNYDTAYPGDGGNWAPWDNYVTSLAASTTSNLVPVQFDIWNEPDLSFFWRRDKATFLETWRRAVVNIREVNPNAEIVGPSLSNYYNTKVGLQEFLLYARDNNVLPDVLAWHEFGSSFVQRVADARTFMANNGIGLSRISINEIVGTGSFAGGQLWQSAGPLARYFSDVERANVESVAHACWDEPNAPGVNNGENNSLDGLLTPDTKQPRSTWWMYEKYGEMAGTVSGFQAGVVKNGAGITTFDGLSTKEDGIAHILIGRFDTDSSLDSGPVELKLTNLDQVPNLVIGGNGEVRVTGERIADSHLAASSGPVTIFSEIMQVVNGQLIVPISQFGSSDGFFLTIATTSAPPPPPPPPPGDPMPTWVRNTGGQWWDGPAWDQGQAPNGYGVSARLGPGNVGQRTIYVDSAWTLGRLVMDDPYGYVIDGTAQLIFDNSPGRGKIEVNAGVNELRVRVQAGIEGKAPDVSVANGATLKIGGGNRLKLATIDLHASGTLDVGGNDLLVEDDQFSAYDNATHVREMLKAGFNGGAWNGAGMRSSEVTATSTMVLAYAEASLIGLGEFDGQPVRPMAVLVLHTVGGDANLDGRLNADDYVLLDRAFALHVENAHWTDGDFNYDGVLDSGDYLRIDTAWGRQTGVLSPGFLADREARFGHEYVERLTALVPEPSVVVLVTTPMIFASRRMRPRSSTCAALVREARTSGTLH